MKKDDKPVIIEESFESSIDQCWEAITNPVLMRQWFFENIPDFKTEVGFYTEFNVSTGERDFLHQWKVLVVPERLIKFNWSYDKYSGDSYVSFNLEPIESGCNLKLELVVTEDFQDDIPEFTRESCIGGWQYFINKQLKEFLDN